MQVKKRASFGFLPPSSPSPLPRPASAIGASASMSSTQAEDGHKRASDSADSTHVKVVLRIRPSTYNDAAIPPRFLRTVLKPSSDVEVKLDADPAMLMGHGLGGGASGTGSKKAPSFSFDRVLPEDSTQVELYEATAHSAVDKFMKGFNVTILAYGQTSSGKSYSMGTTGVETDYAALPPSQPSTPTSSSPLQAVDSRIGIIPRAVSDIFERAELVRRASGPGASFEAKLSFLELYNEDLIDLLGPANGPQVQIREDREGRIIWSGLKEIKVKNTQEVMHFLKEGSARRRTGETGMNATSSRSHAIFSLSLVQRRKANLTASPVKGGIPRPASTMGLPVARSSTPSGTRSQTPSSYTPVKSGLMRPTSLYAGRPSSPAVHSRDSDDEEWVVTTGKFNMVDLAGSERLKRTAAQGERMKEGIAINGGLLALGNVISALGDPAKARTTTYIPYRDSKLTRLLQDSLGGNAYTIMIACVSPIEYNAGETLSTLKYAARARNIKNSAKANQVEAGWDDVEHLQSTVLKLRKEMGALKDALQDPKTGLKDVEAATEGTHGHPARSTQRVADIMRDQDELNRQLLEKSGEIARLTGELQSSRVGGFDAGSDFREAVGPIIAEYEKTVASFEARIQTLQANLASANEVRDEQEELLDELDTRQVQQDAYIAELKARVTRLGEREASHEVYIRDLESKLKAYAEKEESTSDAVAELRKEITKHKESEGRSSLYVAELEVRLSKSDVETSDLRARLETFEAELKHRDSMYRDLEARLAALSSSTETKDLLSELQSRDQKVLHLEQQLQQALQAREQAAVEISAPSRSSTEAEDQSTESIAARPSLITSRTVSTADVFHTPATEIAQPTLSLSAPAPPNGHAEALSTPVVSAPATNKSVDNEDSLRSSETQSELEKVSAKYRAALREIDELASKLEEAKLEHAEIADVLPSSPSIAAPDDEGEAVTLSPRASPRKRNQSQHTSTGSMYELGNRKDFQHGRGPSETNRVRPQSLSQELSSAALSRSSPSSWAESISLLSPNSRNRVSLSPSSRPQRSIQSLEQEVMSLQQALKDRENEIDHLEKSLKNSHGIPSRKNSAKRPLQELYIPQHGVLSACTIPLPPSPGGSPVKPSRDLPFTAAVSPKASPKRLRGGDKDATLTQDEVNRLNELMKSMAQKESAHQQLTIKFQSLLDHSERKYEELQVLAEDQALNMSAELESLRAQLASAGDDRAALAADAHVSALHRHTTQHEAAVARLQEAHRAELAAVKQASLSEAAALEAASTAKLATMQAELDNVLAGSSIQADAISAEHARRFEGQHERLLRESDARHQQMVDEHALALSISAEDHSRQVQALRAAHEQTRQSHVEYEAAALTAQTEAAATSEAMQKAVLEAQDALQKQESRVRAAEAELAESMKAVALLKTALQESDAERGGLDKELSQLRFELSTSRDAYATLVQTSSKREALVSDLEKRLAEASQAREAEAPFANGSAPASSRFSVGRSTSPNGSQIKHPPPMAPPPSMPPPPVPTASQTSCSTSRNSSDSTPATTDTQLASQVEQSERIIATLNKQLSHCEADLQANIDMVNTLESALNDSERNLRKARLQTSEMARERDALSTQAEQLRQQLRTAEQEVQAVRNSVHSERQGLEKKLQEDQQAKERARAQLEARVTAMQNKSSKFQCF